MDYNKWLNHTFSSGTYPMPDYVEFQRKMRFDLKRIAKNNNLELHSFNKNHYEFSAVLKDIHEDKFIYVSISDVRYWKNEWYNHVLIRTMEHDKDWTGGSNHYCKWEEIGMKARELINSMSKQKVFNDLDLELELG